MSGRLFGSAAGGGNAAPPAIAGFRVQTAVYGLPIPIVYGQARIAGNLIHMYPSTATPQLSQGSRNKFVKIDSQVTGYVYQAPIALALCEGPIVGIAKVWRDKDASVPWSTYSAAGWSLFLGTAAQAAWSWLTSNHSADAVPYQLTAYVAHPLLELPNDVLSNYTWEIQGLAQFGFGIVDALPSAILTDVLTNADHGVGFPSAQLGDLSPFAQYCTAAGLFFSLAITGQSPLAEQLAPLIEAANSAFVWSDGKLKVVPYADQAITGNGTTYTPNVTPLYDLTDNDFLAPDGTDPVRNIRKKPSECFNQLTVEYEDRAHDYNPNVQEYKDQASIDAYNVRPAPALRFPAIKDAATARYVAQLKGQREIAIRNTYQFTLGMRYSLLEPMDLVTLTDPGLGLTLAPVRITEIVEDPDGNLQVTAEEFPAGVASASRYGAAGANGAIPANNVAPGATTATAIFEGPGPLAATALEIWLAASGGANWGGCDVHFSTDNVTYRKVGSITRKGSFGVLSAALATAAASPPNDTTHTLAVDLTTSGGALVAGSASDLAARLTLSIVESEFLAFQGASLTSAFHYNLTTLARGLFGSPIPASHAIGATFVRCDDTILKLAYPQGTNGQVVYFKFPAFNVFGLALEDVAVVSAVSHTIGKNTVTTGMAGVVNAPFVTIDEVGAKTRTSATLTIKGGLGSGAVGALTWQYMVDGDTAAASWTTPATTALPQTISISRANWAGKTIYVQVNQPDGQIATASYTIHARYDAIDTATGNVIGTLDQPTGVLGAGVQAIDGTQGRVLTKGYQYGACKAGDAITFSPAFAATPSVVISPANGTINLQPDSTKWSTPASYSATKAVLPDYYIAGLSATGGTMYAKLRQKGGTTPQNIEFPTGNSLNSAGGATQAGALTNAPSVSGHYTVRYTWSVTATGPGGPARTATVVVVINRRAGGPTGAITELDRKSYSVTDTVSGTTNSGTSAIDVASAAISATDYLEVSIASFSSSGAAGTSSCTVHGVNPTNDGGSHGVSFTYGTADITADMTPDTGDTIRWEAYGVQ